METAAALFARRGYDQSTMADLAAEVGIAVGSAYHYFGGKEALLQRICLELTEPLHPRAQAELVAQIRKILEMDPELQVIATSHSPYLLDHFDAQDVLLTALLSDGSTACARLADHPDFDRWKSTTRSGELWSFVGEDWVAQQASAPQERGGGILQ